MGAQPHATNPKQHIEAWAVKQSQDPASIPPPLASPRSPRVLRNDRLCLRCDCGWRIRMKIPRRQFLHLAASAAALPVVSGIARAQAYPTPPVHIVVGFASGGGVDTPARPITPWLSL